MNTLIRFLLTTVLALALITSQGVAVLSSWAASCCPQPAVQKMMACCQNGGYEKHTASNSSGITQKVKVCPCSVTPVGLQPETSSFVPDSGKLAEGNSHNPALSLQTSDSDTPIWLHQLFYPDRSILFLEKNSWLL